MIKIDLEKALEIHKTQIRKKRDELFPSLDVQFMRALEVGNTALSTEVGLKKQALRDITDIDISNVTRQATTAGTASTDTDQSKDLKGTVLGFGAQIAMDNVNTEEFNSLELSSTYVQFNQDTYIVWVGPFDTQKAALSYTQKIKPRLKSELISFLPTQQYEIFIFGKSNILQINTNEDLQLYRDFMLKYIYQ